MLHAKKNKIQDGRRHHNFLYSSGLCPGQTRGPILASDTSDRVFWHNPHKELPCGVQKDKYFSFHPLISRKGIRGPFNAFPSATH